MLEKLISRFTPFESSTVIAPKFVISLTFPESSSGILDELEEAAGAAEMGLAFCQILNPCDLAALQYSQSVADIP